MPRGYSSEGLKPLKNATPTCWYSSEQPLGHNTLSNTISRLCNKGGIHGYKTNHSLRVTNATRLYASRMDEQMVMERTGHRSLEGVRTYKRTSSEQQVALSDVLNRAKKPATGQSCVSPHGTSDQLAPLPPRCDSESNNSVYNQLLSQNFTSGSIPGHFNFQSCSSINITFNCK